MYIFNHIGALRTNRGFIIFSYFFFDPVFRDVYKFTFVLTQVKIFGAGF